MAMKDVDFKRVFVVTADQRRSRRGPDRVPEALDAVATVPAEHVLLPFERTAGDEIQGLLGSAVGVVAVVRRLVRLRDWRIGIGVGAVDLPLATSTRAARGTAYLAARTAVEQARGPSVGIALRDGRAQTAAGPAQEPAAPTAVADAADAAVWRAESALLVWGALLVRRSAEGWEVADLLDDGLSTTAAARTLGISASAASQRTTRAAYAEDRRGAALAITLLAEAAARGADVSPVRQDDSVPPEHGSPATDGRQEEAR
ncbi:transposase [Raineyella sp. LH-20]|uniref:transposase n=1 Tax=Raineyella sp. LH-20 TaxID=3081204 RepID=UPI002952EC44|nr:transposase [Raineyella sp. LH-20]WOP18194.1 transposase [Raineyella sp. LH-20]